MRLATGALRQLVAERNARLILLRLSEETAARELAHRDADKVCCLEKLRERNGPAAQVVVVAQAIQALKT